MMPREFYSIMYFVPVIKCARPAENSPVGLQIQNKSKARRITDPPFL